MESDQKHAGFSLHLRVEDSKACVKLFCLHND